MWSTRRWCMVCGINLLPVAGQLHISMGASTPEVIPGERVEVGGGHVSEGVVSA